MVQKQLSYKYQVYNELKKGILTGQYPPGSVMNERKLSEEMGISRTPIREGLQMLARDGWLQMETYKGAVVREFDPHYMWELSRIERPDAAASLMLRYRNSVAVKSRKSTGSSRKRSGVCT